MKWSDVGGWVKDNGLSVVASLLTGGTSAAIATGISLVQSATGETEPEKALAALKGNPDAMIRLKELTIKDDADVRKHLAENERMKLEDRQSEHSETQKTIRNGDNAKGGVKWVRPSHATASLAYAMWYAENATTVDPIVLSLFLALPFAYGGLRTLDKFGFNPLKR